MLRFSGRIKIVLVLQLSFENFTQSILYIIVATSQNSTANARVSVYVGIVQALCFCAFQIYGLNKELEVGGGAGGNPAAESAA